MDESKQTGSRMAAEGSGSASMACGAVHRQTPKAGARCVNSARRDLCGGYPVTGIPTATLFCEGEIFSSIMWLCWVTDYLLRENNVGEGTFLLYPER